MSVRKRKTLERNLNRELSNAVGKYDTLNTEALLAEGANVNSVYEERPAIFWATPPNLELLLERGAKVDQPYNPRRDIDAIYSGMTALAFFCNIYDPRGIQDDPVDLRERIRILLEHDADTNLADKRGKTPLHHLCEGSMDPAIIRLLIDHGADVNQVDNESNTPLHALVENNSIRNNHAPLPYEEAIQILLGAGADPLLKNEEGHTASEVAQRNNRSLPVIRLLKQAERNAGANVNVPDLPEPRNANANAVNAAVRANNREQLRNQILAMGNAQNEFNQIPGMNQAEFEHILANPLRNNENMPVANHIPHNAGNVNIRNAAPAAGGRRKSRKGKKAQKTRKGRKGRKGHKARKTRRH